MESQYLVKMFDRVFDAFEQLIPEYVLMNKYDVIPYELPSDLDFCVSQETFAQLDRIVPQIAKAADLVVVQKIWHSYRKCAYILSPSHIQEPFRLQLDFFSDFSVKKTPLLLSYSQILRTTRKFRRYTVPDYDLEFIFLLLRRIYKNDFDDEHCDILRSCMNQDLKKTSKATVEYFGAELGEKILDYIGNMNIQKMCELRPALWSYIRNVSKKNSGFVYKTRFWMQQVVRYSYRIIHPVGISIAFLSPDGGGKSTAIELVRKLAWGTFHGSDAIYFRPRLLSNAGSYKITNKTIEDSTNTDPHSKQVNGPLKSLARFFFYNLDFILGTWLKILPTKIKKRMVVFDRYYYDYYADMKRYQYCLSPKFAKAFEWSIPKPNITFVLDAPADVLYERKQELTLEELGRQREIYRDFAQNHKAAVLIDATQSPEQVAQQIVHEIILYKAKKVSKMMHFEIDQEGHPVL